MKINLKEYKEYIERKYTPEFRKKTGLLGNEILGSDDPFGARSGPDGEVLGAVSHFIKRDGEEILLWEIEESDITNHFWRFYGIGGYDEQPTIESVERKIKEYELREGNE